MDGDRTSAQLLEDIEILRGQLAAAQQALTDGERTADRLADTEHLVSATTDMMAFIDEDYRYVVANQAYVSAFAKTADEIIGKTIPEVFGREFCDAVIRPHADRCLAGEIVTYEAWFDFPAYSRQRYMEINYFPTRDVVSGNVDGFVVNARNITDRKLAEQSLQQRTDELARSNGELEQFAYVAAHDLQTPLRTIVSFTSRLRTQYEGQLDAKAAKDLTFVAEAANRMQSLVAGLLDYSRLGRKREATRVDCQRLVGTILADLGATIREAEAHVDVDPLPNVAGNERELRQLFQNLIGNALKFRTQDVPPQIHVGARREGDRWLFSVQDNGIGLDPAQADRAFKIFSRLHTETQYQGAGIGLSLCKKIVELHRGSISVDSQPGKGAKFTFDLPALGAGLKTKLSVVLLIDDNDADNYLNREVLEASGCAERIEAAQSAYEALDLLRGGLQPDLIFLDIHMPGMNGWEFLEAYEELDKTIHSAVRIVMLTTTDDPKAIGRAKGRGVGFSTKPLGDEMLDGILREYFSELF